MRIEELDIYALISEFVLEANDLLEVDASEQAISHQLANKLAPLFQEWNVDCEYNRNHNSVKTLKYALSENGDIAERSVVPDIIIHRRKTNENLLAIELKKVNNKENRFKDQAKLKAFREQLGYRYTMFVDFKTGEDPAIANIVFQAT